MWYSCRASAARKGIKAVRKWHMHDLCNTRGGVCKPSVTQPSRTMGTPWTWNSASAIVSKKYTTHRQAAVLPSARRQHNGRNFWGTQLSSLWVFRKTALHPALDFALGNERKTHTHTHSVTPGLVAKAHRCRRCRIAHAPEHPSSRSRPYERRRPFQLPTPGRAGSRQK